MPKRYLGLENTCINPSELDILMFFGVICGTMCSHAFARRLVVFISPVKPCFKLIFLLFLTTYLKQWYPNMFGYFSFKSPDTCWKRLLYIVCAFTITCIRLPYIQCVPRSVHSVWMSSLCIKYTVRFHVLVNELVTRVSLTDNGAIPCTYICTSGSVARGAMHEIGWKKFKQAGHVYMILARHRRSQWYIWYDYMHIWYCFYVQFYLIILYALHFVRDN